MKIPRKVAPAGAAALSVAVLAAFGYIVFTVFHALAQAIAVWSTIGWAP